VPVAIKRVDASVHVESRITKSCTGRAVFPFEIDVVGSHIILPELAVPGTEPNIAPACYWLQAALDAPFYSASSTESIVIESVCASDVAQLEYHN
jgi:hypothetical protein